MNRSEQETVRINKLELLIKEGFDFPNDVAVNATTEDLLNYNPETELENQKILTLAGRIVGLRQMGKAAFAHLLDASGKGQLYFRRDDLGAKAYEVIEQLDLGDIVEVKGHCFVTKTGEKTLHCDSIKLLVKGLVPLPEKYHGLSDIEQIYRHRYLDLIVNAESRKVFRTRSRIISEIRSFFDQRGFLEVETPILHDVPGGADARPFITKHNSLDQNMVLRIALELPLKKLLVGGFEKVYELSRVFRNEGLSRKHNPEFTMLEFYQAYTDYKSLMNLTEELFLKLSRSVCETDKIPWGEETIDLAPPWPRLSMQESLHEIAGISRDYDTSTTQGLCALANDLKIELESKDDWGRALEQIWGETVEHKIRNPVFITHHPFSISPLARKNKEDPRVVDRFELIIAGMEMANAFSELNDPLDQRERFQAQMVGKADDTKIDEDFLKSLEVGMPPAGGEGIGIDRLVMLLTNSSSIRDVVLFPQLKRTDEF